MQLRLGPAVNEPGSHATTNTGTSRARSRHIGSEARPWPAANVVAAEIGGHSVDATARRLYRKFRSNPEKYSDSLTLVLFEVEQAIKQSGLDQTIQKIAEDVKCLEPLAQEIKEQTVRRENLLEGLRRLEDQDGDF